MPRQSKIRITKRLADQLQKGQSIWDSEVRGFGIRRQVNDRAYVLKYNQNGRQKFLTIGKHGSPWTVDTARGEARALLFAIHNGQDPKRPRQQPTIKNLCDRYLLEHAPRKKLSSAQTDGRLIENHILPILGDRLVVSVSRTDIERFQQAIRDGKTAPKNPRDKQLAHRGGKAVTGGSGISNRCLTLLSKMFNLAEDWEIRPQNTNPVRRIEKYPESKHQRFLSAPEIRQLGKALSEADGTEPYAVAAVRLLILTGARRGEILSLRWEWVDLERRLLLLPDSKTGRKVIRLSESAAKLLATLPRLKGNPFVIAGAKKGEHLVNLQKPWMRFCKTAGVTGARIHDLRHTYASVSVGMGLSLTMTGALLGHTSGQTTERYAHLQKDDVWQASQNIGQAIQSALDGNKKKYF